MLAVNGTSGRSMVKSILAFKSCLGVPCICFRLTELYKCLFYLIFTRFILCVSYCVLLSCRRLQLKKGKSFDRKRQKREDRSGGFARLRGNRIHHAFCFIVAVFP